mmetsp:Transcript_34956/g.6289  ORF Transcript_34956/g.6289 Transcript_34956/m.6289 type:complete len:155 (-) Transcript_34956:44-508(-)
MIAYSGIFLKGVHKLLYELLKILLSQNIIYIAFFSIRRRCNCLLRRLVFRHFNFFFTRLFLYISFHLLLLLSLWLNFLIFLILLNLFLGPRPNSFILPFHVRFRIITGQRCVRIYLIPCKLLLIFQSSEVLDTKVNYILWLKSQYLSCKISKNI